MSRAMTAEWTYHIAPREVKKSRRDRGSAGSRHRDTVALVGPDGPVSRRRSTSATASGTTGSCIRTLASSRSTRRRRDISARGATSTSDACGC